MVTQIRTAIQATKLPLSFSLLIASIGLMLVLFMVRQSQGTAEASILQAKPVAEYFVFQGHHNAPSALGELIFYRWQLPNSGTVEYGYIPVKRALLGAWQVGDGGKCSGATGASAGTLIDFHAHYLWHSYGYNFTSSYSVVCGHTDSANIHAISVLWQDGAVTTDAVTNGWFALVQPDRQAACQLRLLDEANQVTHTIDLATTEFSTTDATTPLPSCVTS